MSSCRECGGPLVPIKDITAWCPNCREADIADDLCRYITDLEADLKASREVSVGLQTMVSELEAENKRLRSTLAQANALLDEIVDHWDRGGTDGGWMDEMGHILAKRKEAGDVEV